MGLIAILCNAVPGVKNVFENLELAQRNLQKVDILTYLVNLELVIVILLRAKRGKLNCQKKSTFPVYGVKDLSVCLSVCGQI